MLRRVAFCDHGCGLNDVLGERERANGSRVTPIYSSNPGLSPLSSPPSMEAQMLRSVAFCDHGCGLVDVLEEANEQTARE